MGATFFGARYGGGAPRVGLLSIGEEDGKGRPQEKETNALLRDTKNVNFIGNVEGRDVMTPDVDVVVTDGFTGNVVLKTLEGGMRFIQRAIAERIPAHLFEDLWPHLEPLVIELDPETYGGAMLLGVDGVCIISHGSSSARAILNAVGVARDMVAEDLVGHLREAVAS
jgi:glycerol-3-phosphate acyltransferase PlsX